MAAPGVVPAFNPGEDGHSGLSLALEGAALDEALTKLFYLALRNISQKWTMPIRDWKATLTRFTIQFGDRISVN